MKLIGKVVFWLAWPFWCIYFRISHTRSRILLIVDGKILLVQGWLSSGEWSLPGGGTKKTEKPEDSAVRELYEETGINVASSSLESLGSFIRKHPGFSYQSYIFFVELDKQPSIKKNQLELADTGWFTLEQVYQLKTGKDVEFAIQKYLAKSGIMVTTT